MVDSLAGDLAVSIRNIADRSKTEEDLKMRVQPLIDDALARLGDQVDDDIVVYFEKRIYKSRRADVLYPGVAIEYKKPHALDNSSVIKIAVDELSDYLKGLAKSENVSKKYVGIALDGYKILFVRGRGVTESTRKNYQMTLDGAAVLLEYDFEVNGPFQINPYTVEQLLIYLRQLHRRVLDAETLSEDFGSKRDLGCSAVRLFHKKLHESVSAKTDILYREWSRIFGIVYGEDLRKAEEEARNLADHYGIQAEHLADVKGILFSIHTYFALLMKMLVAEVLTMQYEGLLSSFARKWGMQDSENLKREFTQLESGGLFRKFDITNFLEGDFFSWYLEEWDEDTSSLIREIAKKLSIYEPATTKLEDDQVKDLLKKLYQYLVPKSIRHDLGEYYTPDWLAEYLLHRLRYDGNPTKRLLDPACGSGTFLTLVLKKILQYVQNDTENIVRVWMFFQRFYEMSLDSTLIPLQFLPQELTT